MRTPPKPGLTRNSVLVARTGELRNLRDQIGALCRRVLSTRYLRLTRQLMPTFENHLSVGDQERLSRE